MKILLTIIGFLISITLWAQKEGDYHLDKEFDLIANGTIELSSSDAKVTIVGTSRKNVHLKIDRTIVTKGFFFGSDDFAIEIDNSNGNLKIEEKANSSSHGIVGYYDEDYEIRIEAPEVASLFIKGDDGNYEIKNVNGSISMRVDDGDVALFGCKGDKFGFRLDDGNLEMDQGKGTIEINVDDGDVNIRNANFSKIVADVDDGDMIIETSLADNGEYNIRVQDGLFSMFVTKGGGQFDVHHDDARVTAEGAFDVYEQSETFTGLKLQHGTAKVDIRADDARVRLSKVN
ncbi:MAG: DUF4097 family beta strand repeat protein [Cyclobacteriaceae bacterium]|nr:DUF4097 family beta strand repeat protein [Cyclobacteriaceae bacterium]